VSSAVLSNTVATTVLPVQQQLIQVDATRDVALLRATLDLYTNTFTDDCELSREELEEAIKQGKYQVLVLPNGNEDIKGFAIIAQVSAHNAYCFLDYFAVSPAFRGNGFGGKLFQMFVQYVSTMTTHKIILLECEERLISFYEKFNARRTQVYPTMCDGKVFYLMAVTTQADPMDHDGNEFHRTRAAFNEIRSNLHGLSNCETSCFTCNDQQIACLVWS
jgi:ribosomal protein S18 acetylase RimI-like enzyme